VRESLGALFEGTGKIRFRLANVHIEVRGAFAWAFVLENIHHGDDVLVAVQATNLFEKTPDGWRLILHHASPISDDAGEPDTDFLQ
jgi:ketosteroid isomerase-like protein